MQVDAVNAKLDSLKALIEERWAPKFAVRDGALLPWVDELMAEVERRISDIRDLVEPIPVYRDRRYKHLYYVDERGFDYVRLSNVETEQTLMTTPNAFERDFEPLTA